MDARGWDRADVVFVSGDAYVDHPSFAASILGRWLEHNGFKVAVLSQPDWKSAEPWRALGAPRLFYAVSAGAMDSMINHYTANRKRRNADAYSPGGAIGRRPDRASAVYAQRCREAFKQVPVVTGGVEASLRRVSHYDYWSDKVLPSSLATSKADLVAYGNGEASLLEIATRLRDGDSIRDLCDMRGVGYMLGRNEPLPDHQWHDAACDNETLVLPSHEDVVRDDELFARATRTVHRETNPRNARRLVQAYGDRRIVINPPRLPLDERSLDALYALPYVRKPHPGCEAEGPIPAWQIIADSVQIMRGCFGGCTFCSITLHQGRTVQSRSARSVIDEIEGLAARPDFKGYISDLGGPTANMYRMGCSQPSVEARCRRLSCVSPRICRLLETGQAPLIDLMKRSREVSGVKKVHIASGIRMDLAIREPRYIDEVARHHVGGHLKVAPEHVSEHVLSLMHKPPQRTFEQFADRFREASRRAGKQQFLVPYFIASHPGSGLVEMVELAVFLERSGYRPRQVQDFIPAPMDIATCMYHTGIDPESLQRVRVAKKDKHRAMQRALLQYFMPDNHDLVKRALCEVGREDLIGEDPGCLISERRPRGSSTKATRKGGSGANSRRGRGGYRWSARRKPRG